MTTATVEVKVINFARGPKYARNMGGRYNPSTKTWTVPADAPELGAIGAYGLAIVRHATLHSDETGNSECFADTWEDAFR